MINSMEELKKIDSLEDMRVEFGRFLGIEKPVPPDVLNYAMEDAKYAAYLVSVRNHPRYLDMLFQAPLNKPGLNVRTGNTVPGERSNGELVGKAAKALVNWGKSGFKIADKATFEKRFDACQSCPFLKAAPEKLAYKFKMSKDADMRMCSACGCVARRKAKLSSESCPVTHPDKPGLNRWEEPLKDH